MTLPSMRTWSNITVKKIVGALLLITNFLDKPLSYKIQFCNYIETRLLATYELTHKFSAKSGVAAVFSS